MKPPRGLTSEEAEAWARVAATVEPLRRLCTKPAKPASTAQAGMAPSPDRVTPRPTSPPAMAPRPSSASAPRDHPAPAHEGLDSHWDRRFARGGIEPDFTLDLHGHTLDSAHARLDAGLAQAKAMGARVVLVIAGKPRAAEAADRGTTRGAIRAKLLDWLAAGPHGADVAAVRDAHRRHGGEGALYLVLKRPR